MALVNSCSNSLYVSLFIGCREVKVPTTRNTVVEGVVLKIASRDKHSMFDRVYKQVYFYVTLP